MQSQVSTQPITIRLLLILQVVPLLLLPPSSFSGTSQEWWLPVLLVLMVIAADIQLIVRRSTAAWPWYLVSFAQGLNIISRLMMIWSHATVTREGQAAVNWNYLIITVAAMLISAFFLWYFEKPAVRVGLAR